MDVPHPGGHRRHHPRHCSLTLVVLRPLFVENLLPVLHVHISHEPGQVCEFVRAENSLRQQRVVIAGLRRDAGETGERRMRWSWARSEKERVRKKPPVRLPG